jgi:hypothetical protein
MDEGPETDALDNTFNRYMQAIHDSFYYNANSELTLAKSSKPKAES